MKIFITSSKQFIRFVALGLLIATPLGDSFARVRPVRPIVAQAGAVSWSPYRYELRSGEQIEAQMGSLTVPARRRGGHGATIELRFVRLPALGAARGSPIIYLAGGPGSSGIDAGRGERWPLFDSLRRHGDVILLDQRGTGLSTPPPSCSQPWTFPNDSASSEGSFNASLERAAALCAAEWREAGLDLASYNTADNAADVVELARALGGRVRLVGISYGTFLAFAILRDHGALIERVVLAGSEGPDHTLKLPLQADRVLEGLSRRYATNPEIPDLRASLARIVSGLETQPVWGEAQGQNGPVRILISKYDVQLATAFLLATSTNAARLPVLVAAMERGDYSSMAQTVLFMRRFYAQLPAMPLAMDAASPVSPARINQARAQVDRSLFENAVNAPSADFARALGVERLPSRWRSTLRTRVPALFVSGELDSRTPPENAEELRRGFRNGVHIVVQGAGHDNDLFFYSPAILERIGAFLDGGAVADEVLGEPER